MSRKQPYRFWTTEDLKHLKYWYGTKPAREIARELGRSVGSVYYMAYRHGLQGDIAPTPARKHCRNKMRSLIMHGMSSYEIAREMGTDPAHISKVVKREMPPEFRNQLLANGRRAHRDAIKRRQAKARRRHGSPCRICGNTERYVSTGVCTNRANHGPRWSITSERKQMLETRRKERLELRRKEFLR